MIHPTFYHVAEDNRLDMQDMLYLIQRGIANRILCYMCMIGNLEPKKEQSSLFEMERGIF